MVLTERIMFPYLRAYFFSDFFNVVFQWQNIETLTNFLLQIYVAKFVAFYFFLNAV